MSLSDAKEGEYQVLARKYRPKKLSELIGQDVLVRTLANAIEQQRLPHAFILTGIRGVGKTSTARIIARSLVCTGEDDKQDQPTINPCGKCANCVAVAQDRHVDILEMDAASRTGVADIREIIESVHYAPVMGRYKVYIIDEVHMLSKNAFNALLKTLEEPPAHAKFIFATTEIRKVPVTILSRCMRFDLARVHEEMLMPHLQMIAEQEGAKIDEDALKVVAHAAGGSVRDALSLLDQAIGSVQKDVAVKVCDVQHMLGISGRDHIFDVLDVLIAAQPAEAVKRLRALYENGADPLTIIQDMLEAIHFVTQIKVVPDLLSQAYVTDSDAERGGALAKKLQVPALARLWQMLLKGAEEVQKTPDALMAAEMVLIRIAYAANLPTPGDLLKSSSKMTGGSVASSSPSASGVGAGVSATASSVANNAAVMSASSADANVNPIQVVNESTVKEINPNVDAGISDSPCNFSDMVDIFKEKNEMMLYAHLRSVGVVNFDAEGCRVTIAPDASTPSDIAGRAAALLTGWTGKRWFIVLDTQASGIKSLAKKAQEDIDARKKEAVESEDVQAVLSAFPGAEIIKVEACDIAEDSNKEISTKIAKRG